MFVKYLENVCMSSYLFLSFYFFSTLYFRTASNLESLKEIYEHKFNNFNAIKYYVSTRMYVCLFVHENC